MDLRLREYPVSPGQKDEPFALMVQKRGNVFTAQSGLIGRGDAPNHHSQYVAEERDYALEDGEDTLEVPLMWEGEQVTVTKTYRFKRGSYLIQVSHEVENKGEATWSGSMYGQILRTAPNESDIINTYTGGVVSGPERLYEKVGFDDMESEDLRRDIKGGWVAMIQRHFVGAWIPHMESSAHYYTKVLDEGRFVIGAVGSIVEVPPKSKQTLEWNLYAGPKIQERLQAAGPGLELTVDYGMFFVIAQPISLALQSISRLTGNWAWSVVILTLLTVGPFYLLTIRLYRRRTRAVIAAINGSRGPREDAVELSRKFMDKWRSKKNRSALTRRGLAIWVAFPMLTMASHWVFVENVELRHAPFTWWWNDLSGPDPTLMLPVIYLSTILWPDFVLARHHRWMRRWWYLGLIYFSLGAVGLAVNPLALIISWTLIGAVRMFCILRLTQNMGAEIASWLGIEVRAALTMLAQK